MVDVFISYPRAERDRVEPIRDKLAALDLDLFFDIDGIDSSAAFPSIIDRALKASKAVLCCWSPLYFTRDWCLIECRYAAPRGKLVAVRIEAFDAEAPPADLMQYSFYDICDWSGQEAHEDWNRVLKDLEQKVGRPLAPKLTRGPQGGLTAGPAPDAPKAVAQKADLLEDLRKTWAAFPVRDDAAMVRKFLDRVRAQADGSGLEFEVEHHLDGLQRRRAARRAVAEGEARQQIKPRPKTETRAAEVSARTPRPDAGRPAPSRWTPGAVLRDRLTLETKPSLLGRLSGARPSAEEVEGPEMVVIPAGEFVMGSPEDEPERSKSEGPQHRVRIARSFALGRYAVTFEEYDAFCAATGADKPNDRSWGRGRRPAINVSWDDANAYCAWLSEQTGADYRLPSEAEWEYACRAGTETPFWWGREITPEQANYHGNFVYAGGGAKGVYREKTEPVDAFEPNPWGLYQTHGNVLEWCQDA
ncbi:MAG: SUMF1/EgtB/PvdO family nonheme iron enzyme, partial [Pseudomonadota bacterium]